MHRRLTGQSVLLVGPGWLGATAAAALYDEGASVWTLRRGTAVPQGLTGAGPARPTGPIALAGDIRHSATDVTWAKALPATLDAVVVCIAPSRSTGDTHETTYPASLRAAMHLATERSARAMIYTSSTGVYGRTDGRISREEDIIVPDDDKQQALLSAEAAVCSPLHATTTTRTVLRVAGLYGPGRDPAARFALGIPSAANDVWCNFSWREDVVAAIVHFVADPNRSGAVRLFNCADGHPIRASTIARALGATESAPDNSSTATPRGRSNQQIFVDPLRATGWRPTMPCVFDGLQALGHSVRVSDKEFAE